jgi:hypothetical protein
MKNRICEHEQYEQIHNLFFLLNIYYLYVS